MWALTYQDPGSYTWIHLEKKVQTTIKSTPSHFENIINIQRSITKKKDQASETKNHQNISNDQR